jgi:hypothetical protein
MRSIDLSSKAALITGGTRNIGRAIGAVTALVLCHCQSVNSDILGTSVASFDLHFAVNARA